MLRSYSRKAVVCLSLILLLLMGFGAVLTPAAGAAQPDATAGAPEAGIERVDETWTMHDGVRLPVSVFYPAVGGIDGEAAETYPTIIFVHAWDCEKLMLEGMAKDYAARGYVTVTYTVRGWYGAEGQIGCMDPEYEMRDLSDIITMVTEDARFPVLWDEEGPVVGVTGYSMGACHTFLIAPRRDPRDGDPGDPRVRAVVPMHGGTDLLFSIVPNGAAKALWGLILVGGSYMGNLSGFMMNVLDTAMREDMDALRKLWALIDHFWKLMDRPFNNVTPMLAWATGAFMERRVDDRDEASRYLQRRSMRYWCDQEYDGVVEHPVTAPMLILTGWNDDIFYANEGLRALSSYMDADTPARMIVTNHGHIGGMDGDFLFPMPGNPEYEWVKGQIRMWFDHYLKGEDNGADEAPRLVYYRGPGDYGEADRYPLAGTKAKSLYLDSARTGGKLSNRTPRSATASPDLLVNFGLTGSISIPYFHDVTEMMGGEALQIPTRLKLLTLPLTERSYISDPLTRDVSILGAPLLEIHYMSSAPFTQLIPWIYEVAPDGTEKLVSRGYYEGYNPSTWTMCSTAADPVEMQAIYHRFAKGSRIKLEISTADLLMTWPHFGLAFIQLFRRQGAASRIILPVVPNGS